MNISSHKNQIDFKGQKCVFQIDEDGNIKIDDQKVGEITWSDNTIYDLIVYRQYRNKGVATEAVSQYVNFLKCQEKYEIVRCVAVISDYAKKVLRKNGFQYQERKSTSKMRPSVKQWYRYI